MLHVVLYQPEIPPNTGNIIRLCANTGFQLHLIEPLGFVMDDKRLRRAGLDYGEWQTVKIHRDWQNYLDQGRPNHIYALSTKGSTSYSSVSFHAGDALLFGPETRGLPGELRLNNECHSTIRLPMQPDSRSLNLSNAAAIVVYEAWRQLGFDGGQ
jgi:tRNA (cytidine/uridine-2'-O-)-methyltransferase